MVTCISPCQTGACTRQDKQVDKVLLERIELEKRLAAKEEEFRQTSSCLEKERSRASKRRSAYSERMVKLDAQIAALEHSLRNTRVAFKDHAGAQTRSILSSSIHQSIS